MPWRANKIEWVSYRQPKKNSPRKKSSQQVEYSTDIDFFFFLYNFHCQKYFLSWCRALVEHRIHENECDGQTTKKGKNQLHLDVFANFIDIKIHTESRWLLKQWGKMQKNVAMLSMRNKQQLSSRFVIPLATRWSYFHSYSRYPSFDVTYGFLSWFIQIWKRWGCYRDFSVLMVDTIINSWNCFSDCEWRRSVWRPNFTFTGRLCLLISDNFLCNSIIFCVKINIFHFAIIFIECKWSSSSFSCREDVKNLIVVLADIKQLEVSWKSFVPSWIPSKFSTHNN